MWIGLRFLRINVKNAKQLSRRKDVIGNYYSIYFT